MPLLRVQHSFQGSSGLARDRFVNTFYFAGGPLVAGELEAMADAVQNFYEQTPAALSSPVVAYISSTVTAFPATIAIYNTDDPMPRQPIFETTWQPNQSDTQDLPAEVACCLSYRALPVSGEPQARRRGRLFIGPLNINVLSSTVGLPEQRPKTIFITTLNQAAAQMASQLPVNWSWQIYSPRDGISSGIQEVWVDDAFDTQRRRGCAPTMKTVLAVQQ